MKKHTFKQGDRVFGQICTGDLKIPGVFVKMGGWMQKGCIIRRDDGVSGIEPGLYWFANYLTTHDTNFQVGDWVRYEKVDEIGTEEWNGKVGIITWVDDDGERFPAANVDGIAERLLQANLVKIQPPQETHVKPINIKHEKYGIVKGVNVLQGGLDHGFTKDGAHYFVGNGWSQVPEVEWITIQVEKQGWSKMKTYCLVYGPRGTGGNEHTKWRYPQ